MDKIGKILTIEKEGMFMGVTLIPECWESPMNISKFIEGAEEEEDLEE